MPPTGFEPVCADLNFPPTGRPTAPLKSGWRISPPRVVPQWNGVGGKLNLEKRRTGQQRRAYEILKPPASTRYDPCLKQGLQVNWSNEVLNRCSAPELQVREILRVLKKQNGCRQFPRTWNGVIVR
jgi:hypothetical protein